MTGGGRGDDGSMSDLPWAAVFDPSVNVRALGEIQARGFRAASELVDRFVRAAGPERTASNADPEPQLDDQPGSETQSTAALPDVERLLGSWKSMVSQVVGSISNGTTGAVQRGPAMFDLAADRATGEIALLATEPGAVSAEVWVHNAGGVDMGKVRLRCTDLTSHDGSVIESALVRFEPDTIPMPARSSRGVTVEVDLVDDLAPGVYHGTLLADGYPDVWMSVRLTLSSSV